MSNIHRRRRALAIGVLSMALGVAACAVPTNDEPVELSGSVPFGLLESTTTSTSTPQTATKQAVVYMLETEDGTTILTEVVRDVDLDAGVQEVLANLFTRPPGDEPGEFGLSSAIPQSATLLSAARSQNNPGRLVVDVRGLFGSIQGVDLRDALAQIVWTATAPGTGITEVVFRNDGEQVQALVDDLESVEGAVDKEDYSKEN